LAQGDDGASGIHWLEELAEAGKAMKRSGNGYPNRLHDPRRRRATPSRPSEANPATQQYRVHAERIAACPADKLLTIDAWDQS
jgi:hypothetical protein